jgi:large subunit ribosomal protein L35
MKCLKTPVKQLEAAREWMNKPPILKNFTQFLQILPVSPYLCGPKKNSSFSDISHKAQKVSILLDRQQGVTQNSYVMPKVKTNSSAKKRFKVTGSGKITFQKAFKRHILTKKSTKRKRNMRKDGVVSDANLHFVKRLLGLK